LGHSLSTTPSHLDTRSNLKSIKNRRPGPPAVHLDWLSFDWNLAKRVALCLSVCVPFCQKIPTKAQGVASTRFIRILNVASIFFLTSFSSTTEKTHKKRNRPHFFIYLLFCVFTKGCAVLN